MKLLETPVPWSCWRHGLHGAVWRHLLHGAAGDTCSVELLETPAPWTCLVLSVAAATKEGHHQPPAPATCTIPATIIQGFLSSVFPHCYFRMSHNNPSLREKMQFYCRPRHEGRVANNATCNNQKTLAQ